MALHERSDRPSPGRRPDSDQERRRRRCHGRVQPIHFWDGPALVLIDAHRRPELCRVGLPATLVEHSYGH
jgi:hypothetical protein